MATNITRTSTTPLRNVSRGKPTLNTIVFGGHVYTFCIFSTTGTPNWVNRLQRLAGCCTSHSADFDNLFSDFENCVSTLENCVWGFSQLFPTTASDSTLSTLGCGPTPPQNVRIKSFSERTILCRGSFTRSNQMFPFILGCRSFIWCKMNHRTKTYCFILNLLFLYSQSRSSH